MRARMIRFRRAAKDVLPVAGGLLLLVHAPAAAQSERAATVSAQREAMQKLSFMDGEWRGPSWTETSNGRLELILTERIGTMLDGTIRMMSGRGYQADGSVGYQALGIIDYNPSTRSYRFTTWSLGSTQTFPFTIADDGFEWETPGPDGTRIRYRARISRGAWHEIGERVARDGSVSKVTEIRMERLGDSSWPAGKPVPIR